jgi:membrane protein YqaA with SNARE-associated domain
LVEQFAEYGYLGLFLASFLAATVVPFSSEALLGVMVAAGFSLWSCIFFATAGNFAGGMTSYYLGYLGNWEKLSRFLKFKKEKFDKWEVRLRKYGVWFALLSWLPFVGDVLVIGLGLIRANIYLVSIFMLIGKFARYLVLAFVTYKAFL